MAHLCSTPASVHEKVGCDLGPSHRTLPTLIVSPFVCPPVGLFVEKLSPVSSDFNEDGEESEIHPLMKNLDDASKYVSME